MTREPLLNGCHRHVLFDVPDACNLNLLECAAIRIERGLLASQLLPALDHHVDVLGIKLDAVTDTLG